jgi:hypothetical protein
MSETKGTAKPPRKPRKRKLENGAILHCITSDGKNALNIFETDNKLTFTTFSNKKKDFDTFTINIKNGKLNIFEKTHDRGVKRIRNVTRKSKLGKYINRCIKNSLRLSGLKFEPSVREDDDGAPF